MTDHQDGTITGPVDAAQLRGIPGPSPLDAGTAQLVDALRQLSTLLLLTADAADNIVAALTGHDPYAEPVRTGHRTDTAPDTGADSARPTLAIVRPVGKPPRPAPYDGSPVRCGPYAAPYGADAPAHEPAYVRDVEPRDNAHWRGRVRWLDPATKRYRSRSKNFDDPAAAWAWAARWTPDVDQR